MTFPASFLSELLDRGQGAVLDGVEYICNEPYDVRDWHTDMYAYFRTSRQPATECWRIVARLHAGGYGHTFPTESPEGVPARLEREVSKTVMVWEDAE